jgi:NADP-dependent 3-hydroxy acid dehydrogenase YdfG
VDEPAAAAVPDRLKVPAKGTHVRPRTIGPGDVTFRWHFEVVTGDEGRAVRQAQATAIGELVRWLYEQKKQRR